MHGAYFIPFFHIQGGGVDSFAEFKDIPNIFVIGHAAWLGEFENYILIFSQTIVLYSEFLVTLYRKHMRIYYKAK